MKRKRNRRKIKASVLYINCTENILSKIKTKNTFKNKVRNKLNK